MILTFESTTRALGLFSRRPGKRGGGERLHFSPSPEKTESLTHVKTVFRAALPLKYAA